MTKVPRRRHDKPKGCLDDHHQYLARGETSPTPRRGNNLIVSPPTSSDPIGDSNGQQDLFLCVLPAALGVHVRNGEGGVVVNTHIRGADGGCGGDDAAPFILIQLVKIQNALQLIGVFGAVEVEPGLVNFCVTEKVSKENLDAVLTVVSSLGDDAPGVILSEAKDLLTEEE